MAKEFYIQKQRSNTPKNAIRVNSPDDIPFALRDTIRFMGDHLELETAEGPARCAVGLIIDFEKTDKTKTGYGAWPIPDESRVYEKDGRFYANPKPTLAAIIDQEIPDMLSGCHVERNENGSFTLTTERGSFTGFPGEALWLNYGIVNGTLDVNVLTMTEPSFFQYNICTPDGQDICPLTEWREYLEQERDDAGNVEYQELGEDDGFDPADD